ncbi:MAG: isoleucine--tRNA ligase [Phycisphaerales bacterium]
MHHELSNRSLLRSADAPQAGGAPKEKNRYKETLNLPSTPFPMKAGLVQNEPASLKRWAGVGVYQKLRASRAGRPRFVFHDGPPYANGSIHLGHLMNKCLKDFVVRTKGMQGLDVPYTPGWDCHGLPIEHKVMLEMQEKGKAAKLATLSEDQRKVVVRRECQAYAEKYVRLHKDQMTRLLTLADYENPYLTMAPAYEGATLEVLATLLERGLVYRQLKPVHWSPANETALADAELEYEDREDPSVYVDFEAADADAVYRAFGLDGAAGDEEDEEGGEDGDAGPDAGGQPGEGRKSRAPRAGTRPLQRPCFMIWTTTPWTLCANLAIAVNPAFEYALVWIDGNVTVLAADAVARVTAKARSEEAVVLARTTGDRLLGLRYKHPFVTATPAFPKEAGGDPANCYKVVGADYVTLEDGTGLVHTAPGHGAEDYQTGLREKIPVYCPVKENGAYDTTVPVWLQGMNIWDANKAVVKHLRDSGHMFHDHVFTHSYPHDWRSKTPVIFRCTEQWFVGVELPFSVDGDAPATTKARALAATQGGGVAFVPEWGRNRMRGMLESRPDWCISRQRAWGLPIPAFFGAGGGVLMTPASVRAVSRVFREQGSDAWFTRDAAELLKYYDPGADPALPPGLRGAGTAGLRKGNDILDVWFESGSSWYSCMKERGQAFTRPDRSDTVDLYLEGSDQHRGWFQLSLLPALGVIGHPPFRTLLTHGFMVDRDGKKLSKSRPDAHRYEVDSLCTEFGMDVMRWWVSSLAYENDVKVDVELFALAGESYRKVRNTLRFMLSNLSDFTSADPATACSCGGHCVPLDQVPPESLDAWVLGEFDALGATVVRAYNAYDFQTAHKALFDFCNTTLSAEYLAAVKDRLYCDKADSPRRRRTQTVLWDLTDGLCRLLAPILCHTADEAYRALHKSGPDDRTTCVHLQEFPAPTGVRPSPGWAALFDAARAAQVEIEKAKTRGIENPLDAGVTLPLTDALRAFDTPSGRIEAADLLGVSRASFDGGIKAPVIQDLRGEPRCERSWKRDGTVRLRSDGGMLTDRDASAVGVG